MKGKQAACPACAGPVEFKIGSAMVAVCEFCRTVVARGDRKLEDYGKVAALVETQSPLHLGLRGKYNGKRFDLVGRVQFQHPAGGVWDEWYLAFSNGKWGWLAEAQGQFHLTFERKISEETQLPALEDLEVGRSFELGSAGKLAVAEIGKTKPLGAEGELPFALNPREEHHFADLAGPDGVFATFDYSTSPPSVFLGNTVTLEEIGLADAVAPDREATRISSIKVSCPQCAGSLELHAPDQTQRVTCPFCSSLLDANQGNLQYLKTLEQGAAHPVIPLGSVGTLFDIEYTVIGYVRRSVRFDIKYFWSEYLLYNPTIGFRWLIHSDNHWSFAEPISIGDVENLSTKLYHQKQSYRLFQRARAEVEYVLGEFYWKVEVGESVWAKDFICPPYLITVERTLPHHAEAANAAAEMVEPETQEVIVTKSTYLPHADVEEAFDVENLAKGWTPAPNQPNPVDGSVFAWWGIFAAILLVLDIIFLTGVVKPKVDQGIFFWAMVFVSIVPIGSLIYRFMFESSRWKDSEFNPYATSE